jgi:hypothetical protein
MDFHDINRGGESHGRCDQRFATAVRCIGCDEDGFFLRVGQGWTYVLLAGVLGHRVQYHFLGIIQLQHSV